MGNVCGMTAAEDLGDLHLPACDAQWTKDAAHEGSNGDATGGGVVKQQSFAHGMIIADKLKVEGSKFESAECEVLKFQVPGST